MNRLEDLLSTPLSDERINEGISEKVRMEGKRLGCASMKADPDNPAQLKLLLHFPRARPKPL